MNFLSAAFSDAGYTITIVEDEAPVALAGALPGRIGTTPLFTGTVVVMALIMAAVILALYFVQCRQLQLRINNLMSGASTVRKGRYSVWNYRSLKAECARLEYIISDKLINETVQI